MIEHDDSQLEPWLRDAARAYHTPPATPREAMWDQLTARRRRRVLTRRVTRWALAAAAVLALGVGIGRWSAGHGAAPDDSGAKLAGESTTDARRDFVYHVAATQYLSRTEAFLTGFRAELQRAGRGDQLPPRFTGQARDLLSTTRLMLDSPAADDARLRSLLEDLELVLAQIAQFGASDGADAELITQGMDHANVLPKLRSAIPAGPLAVRTEGVL
ncbi:MAG: hypothetical protein ACREMN_13060 [Gemmatimonadales bacterium]